MSAIFLKFWGFPRNATIFSHLFCFKFSPISGQNLGRFSILWSDISCLKTSWVWLQNKLRSNTPTPSKPQKNTDSPPKKTRKLSDSALASHNPCSFGDHLSARNRPPLAIVALLAFGNWPSSSFLLFSQSQSISLSSSTVQLSSSSFSLFLPYPLLTSGIALTPPALLLSPLSPLPSISSLSTLWHRQRQFRLIVLR